MKNAEQTYVDILKHPIYDNITGVARTSYHSSAILRDFPIDFFLPRRISRRPILKRERLRFRLQPPVIT